MKTHRPARVGELIKREVSDMLIKQQIKDLRIGAGMVSVTDVEVSGDLRQAKIYVSIFGTPEVQKLTMAALGDVTGFVRQEIGHRIRLRYTPEISFVQDHSLERGARISQLIDQIRAEEEARAEQREDEP
ncbi:30S ribosome-binding factor RbfA [Gloeobacter kilaueensis]|uniref:Ribosome-binding factor A n=1 Tax=Gloeobacter kilaueensis (strain ATCC BAA-2537 / CCAP 1431/1 / ULC 316 / JS1) TaxID=1183438 RepID=U5QMN6_GLOK1|nr:30S ribosome-binding factor RbfA [Gloeobacter kilaueensis]AGY60163.1 ribosome-binding factor A [Gloeobacter kilaueensis JS1]